MNTDVRIVKWFLRLLSHPFQMLTRWSAKIVRARKLKSRFPPFQVGLKEVPVEFRQGPSQAVPPNPVSPERDFPGVRWLL
jgi:hypothetical protein